MLKRVFIALDIAAKTKQEIALWREEHLSLPFKTVSKDNLHITLHFIGLIDSEQQTALIQAINNAYAQIDIITPCRVKSVHPLQLSQLGLFKRPQVLYASAYPVPDWLQDLRSSIATLSRSHLISGAYPDSTPDKHSLPYIPHLSLYRKAKAVPSSASIKIALALTTFSLYHSYNANNRLVYEPICTWLI